MESQPLAYPNQENHGSIFSLALRAPLAGSADAHALSTLFDIHLGTARCRVSSLLAARYGTASAGTCCSTLALWFARSLYSSKEWNLNHIASAGLAVNNEQQVVSVTDRVLGTQVWYNRERSRKPQTFTQVLGPD